MLLAVVQNFKPRIRCYLRASISSKTASHCRSYSSSPQIIFSGIQPTGVPHLGNYLGALKNWVQLQDEAPATTQLFFSIVDLHAITTNQPARQIQDWKRQTLAALLAVGLDPERSTIFYQSSVAAHAELMWILSCTASVGYLSRMTQWKTKLALPSETSALDSGAKAKLKLGLFSYPVLQAADILLYGTTHVPVGEDQAQHVEFARECAGNFNGIHGEILKKPATIISPAKRIMSLKEPQLKMSKSHPDERSRILISDKPEEIRMKIRLALTDSMAGISYDPSKRPGISNLISIMAYLRNQENSCEELAHACNSLSLRDFKERVASTIIDDLSGIRARYEATIHSDRADFLETVVAEGARKARKAAESKMAEVRRAIGL